MPDEHGNKTADEMMEAFEERMDKKRAAETETHAVEERRAVSLAEARRTSYLKRRVTPKQGRDITR
jgi:hypothetical protein